MIQEKILVDEKTFRTRNGLQNTTKFLEKLNVNTIN